MFEQLWTPRFINSARTSTMNKSARNIKTYDFTSKKTWMLEFIKVLKTEMYIIKKERKYTKFWANITLFKK